MRINDVPFNVFIVQPDAELTKQMRQVTVNDIFEPGTQVFHPDGLFSTETFGPVGSDERDLRFGFIKLNTRVFNALIYLRLGTLKKLYHDIIMGKRLAEWDPERKDFYGSDEISGETGFAFFVKYFPELVLDPGDSNARNTRIALINKYRDKALMDRVLVQPAGLRDYELGDNGRHREGEINTFYRSILATSQTISSTETGKNDPILDPARVAIQKQVNGIFDLVFGSIRGKRGVVLGKWASRTVVNGTSNVITPMEVSAPFVGSKRSPGINAVQVGMMQFLKMFIPKIDYYVRNGWVSQVINTDGSDSYLTDKKTLRRVPAQVSAEAVERWTTREGIEAQIKRYGIRKYRQQPIMIDGHYLGLVYAGKDYFKIFQDIEELPKEFDKAHVYPLNMTTLFYLSGYRFYNDLASTLTRYPVAGPDSTYIGNIFLRTTVDSTAKRELGPDWQPLDAKHVAYQFPSQDLAAEMVETLSPHLAKLGGLAADFDGDKSSAIGLYADDSIAEYNHLRRTREWYVSADGSLRPTASTDNIELLLTNITGGL